MMSERKNVILADCDSEEIKTFKEGLEHATGKEFIIESFISNGGHGSIWAQLWRYWKYFIVPLRIYYRRKEYGIIVGWQQFYANIFAFYCRIFNSRKENMVISCNFTYKRKSLFGRLYFRFMKYALNNDFIDYLHVPSHNYACRCSEELNIPKDKFIITTFGIPDIWYKWKNSNTPDNKYVLSIGRSNRDFDFLLDVWSEPVLKDFHLVLISDTYSPRGRNIPPNVTLYNNIIGEKSMQWFAYCEMIILPIEDGNIASGDTVLLTGMQFEKTVVITKPSTLAEMYINDGVDGIVIEKDVDSAAIKISELMRERQKRIAIGKCARKTYLEKFSRYSLGEQLGKAIKQ